MNFSQDIQQVNIHEAKTHLSALLNEKTQKGESFAIAKAGKPIAIVEPYSQFIAQDISPRTGFLKRELDGFDFPEDFDTMMQDEIASLFEGEGGDL
jgi:antitoxin (DNA-binding transcriptional repressor) of toxin-antitoxin stability system